MSAGKMNGWRLDGQISSLHEDFPFSAAIVQALKVTQPPIQAASRRSSKVTLPLSSSAECKNARAFCSVHFVSVRIVISGRKSMILRELHNEEFHYYIAFSRQMKHCR
jgi:hypothetical protein